MDRASSLTFGELVRRLRRQRRWQVQDLAAATGLSLSHLSRIENDNALPTAETVVKLSTALDGELEHMLELANCLPREILDRLLRRAADGAQALRRSAGDAPDNGFARALVEEIDPSLRSALAERFGFSSDDVDAAYTVLQRMSEMRPGERETVLDFLAARARRQEP